MSVNKVILVGNVGRDPEVRYVDSGVGVANFTIATTERGYKTAAGTDVPERTEWHNIVAWRGLATLAENYIRKGSQIFVEGKLRTRNYTDQTGNTRYTTEIVADVIQLLGRKGDVQINPLQPAAAAAMAPAAGNSQAPLPAESDPFGGGSNRDTDLPF